MFSKQFWRTGFCHVVNYSSHRSVDTVDTGAGLSVAEVLVRKVPDDQRSIDLRVAVLGNVDAGKSTLVGVLTQGQLDNGRGLSRLNMFRHKHECKKPLQKIEKPLLLLITPFTCHPPLFAL